MRTTGAQRVSIAAAVAALVLATVTGTASAEPAVASELTFTPSSPTYDPSGQGTTLMGEVSVSDQGWLDFYGRSVVTTPSRANLNPGTSDFTFGARIALTRGLGDWNVMQKGNWGDQQWKLSTHIANGGATLSCRFNGSAGTVHVFTSPAAVATDGSWHQVACVRAGNTVRVEVDGVTVAQGSGPTGSISSTKPYLIGSKGVTAADPDQYLGLLDDAFVIRDDGGGVSPPVNRPPTARLDVTCTALSCAFDASTSSDPDGDPLTYTWDLGDGTAAGGATIDHAYASAGTYTVQVEARDPDGATSVASTTVHVAETTTAVLGFRDISGTSTNAKKISPQAPTAAQPGDALLLFVTANRSDITLQAPAGWQQLGTQVDGSMLSQLWGRVAQAGDAGSSTTVTSTAAAKVTAHVLAYSGTSAVNPFATTASAAEVGNSAAHTSPLTTASPTSWVVSLWANKSTSTSGWTVPASVTTRQFLATSGSGRITSLVADSGGPIGSSSAGGLTATASQSGNNATMWTVVLTPDG